MLKPLLDNMSYTPQEAHALRLIRVGPRSGIVSSGLEQLLIGPWAR